MGRFIFWLSFLSGVFANFGFAYQSVNIAALPALTYLLFGSRKKIPHDCTILIILSLFHLCVSLYYFSADSIISLFQLFSVFAVYISLRLLNYFPSYRGVFNFLFINLFVGFFQISGLGARGVKMLESEPSRSARSLLVLMLPISTYFHKYKNLIPYAYMPIILLLFCVLNRSGSLILILGYAFIILFLYFYNWIKSLLIGNYFINKKLLVLILPTCVGSALLFVYFSKTRFVYVFLRAYSALWNFSGTDSLVILLQIAGRRMQTVLPIYANAIGSWPLGIEGYKVFINFNTLSEGLLSVTQYHLDIFERRASFDPASFSAASIAQGGFISFALLLCFSVIAWMLFQNKCKTALKFHNKWRSFEIYSSTAAFVMAVVQLWFFSTDSILQPWLLLALSINYLNSENFIDSNC